MVSLLYDRRIVIKEIYGCQEKFASSEVDVVFYNLSAE